jgi:hypothetical protein
MISILETIFWWLAIIIGSVLVCGLIYFILYWFAYSAATKYVKEQEQKLAQEREKLNQREIAYKADADKKYQQTLQIKQEADEQKEKAKEILSNAEKLRETSEIKIQKIKKKTNNCVINCMAHVHAQFVFNLRKEQQLKDNSKIKKQNFSVTPSSVLCLTFTVINEVLRSHQPSKEKMMWFK